MRTPPRHCDKGVPDYWYQNVADNYHQYFAIDVGKVTVLKLQIFMKLQN